MYNAKRTDAYFHGELHKFIQVTEDHARNEKIQLIHCLCKACKNLIVLISDPTTIKLHVVVSSFVKNYTIWKYHGEIDAPPPMNNLADEIISDDEFNRMFDAYYDMMVAEMMGLVDSMVMISMTGPSMVIVVMVNLTMVIF